MFSVEVTKITNETNTKGDVMKKLVVIAIGLVSLFCQSSKAEIFQFKLGMNNPTSKLDGNVKDGNTGLYTEADVLFPITHQLAVGVGGLYAGRSKIESNELVPGGTTSFDAFTLGLLAVGKMKFDLSDSVIPYLNGGVGISESHANLDMRPQPGYYWVDTNTTESRTLINEGKSSPIYTIGGGLNFRLNKKNSLLFEVGYIWSGPLTYTASLGGTKEDFKGTFKSYVVSVGYAFAP